MTRKRPLGVPGSVSSTNHEEVSFARHTGYANLPLAVFLWRNEMVIDERLCQ